MTHDNQAKYALEKGLNTAKIHKKLTSDVISKRIFSPIDIKGHESEFRKADFINCVAWEKTAELMCSYLRKGSQIGVEGRIQTRNYDDPNVPNRKVYVTEVVVDSVTFLESKSTSDARQNGSASEPYYPDDNYDMVDTTPTLKISSDDLPF